VVSLPLASDVSTGDWAAQLLAALKEHRPDWVMTTNHKGFDASGRIHELLSRTGIPVVSWFVDHPRYIFLDQPHAPFENLFLFFWEKTAYPNSHNWVTMRNISRSDGPGHVLSTNGLAAQV